MASGSDISWRNLNGETHRAELKPGAAFYKTSHIHHAKMTLHELASTVGREHVVTGEADLTPYGVDIRLYDERSTIKTVRRVLGIDVDHGAYRVIDFDGFEEIVEAQERHAFAICEQFGGENLGEEAGRQWWEHRYDFRFPPKVLDFLWLFGTLDTVCTFEKLEPLYWAKRRALEETYKEVSQNGKGQEDHKRPQERRVRAC